MTWTTPVDRTTGTLITAAMWNQMLGVTGNITESAAGKVTTAGDFVVATGANALTRIHTDNIFPWDILVDLFTGTPSANNADFSGPFPGSSNQPTDVQFNGTQNAYAEWPIVLAAGTWTVFARGFTDTVSGISTVSFDGASVGTMDWYENPGGHGRQKSITGIAVAATGKKLVRITMATKNGSSGAYKLILQGLKLRRTA